MGDAFDAQVFECVSLAVRDIMVDRLLDSEERYRRADAKHLCDLSIEYLPGRYLASNLINLGIYDLCRETLVQMGVDWEAVEVSERDPALGNGGLGRLAACFLDSLATLGMPGYGYGINYQYGLFRQEIDRGDQKEKPDTHRIHRIAGIGWRVSHKRLILFTDWVSRPLRSPDHSEPHPPCTTIRLSRSGFQPSDARNSLLHSMAGA